MFLFLSPLLEEGKQRTFYFPLLERGRKGDDVDFLT